MRRCIFRLPSIYQSIHDDDPPKFSLRCCSCRPCRTRTGLLRGSDSPIYQPTDRVACNFAAVCPSVRLCVSASASSPPSQAQAPTSHSQSLRSERVARYFSMRRAFQEDRNITARSDLRAEKEVGANERTNGEGDRFGEEKVDGLDLEEQRVAGRRRYRRRRLRPPPSPLWCRPGPPTPPPPRHSCCSRLFSPTAAAGRKQRASHSRRRRRRRPSAIKKMRAPPPPIRGQQAMTVPTQVRKRARNGGGGQKEGRETVCFAGLNAGVIFSFRPSHRQRDSFENGLGFSRNTDKNANSWAIVHF